MNAEVLINLCIAAFVGAALVFTLAVSCILEVVEDMTTVRTEWRFKGTCRRNFEARETQQ